MPESLLIAAIAGIIVVSLAALAAGWNQIDDFLKRRAGTDSERTVGPQPFVVKTATEFVHKQSFEQHVQHNTDRHAQIFEQIRVLREDMNDKLKQDTDALHEKANGIAVAVAGLEATTEIQNQQLANIVTVQNQILQRLPRKA